MSYFENITRYPEITVDTICHALSDPKFGRVDFIVGTGISGTLVLLPVAIRLKIHFAAVRKLMCGSHANNLMESSLSGENDAYRYVIIDDFVSSGETLKTVKKTMRRQYEHARCVGVVLYQGFPYNDEYILSKLGEGWEDTKISSLADDIIDLTSLRAAERFAVLR